MTPQQEALSIFRECGSKRETARRVGIPESTLRGWIAKAEAHDANPEGVKQAIRTTGTEGIAKRGWRIIVHPDGSRDSVMWEAEKTQTHTPEDIIDRISDRLNRIQPAPYIQRPVLTRSDLRNFIPLFDVHLSMRVGEYGTAEAVKRLQDGGRDLLDRAEPAECTIILNGGDFTHQNDGSNLTPRSQHPLPVDAEYEDTTDIGTDVTAELIEYALTKSDRVIYKALKGNHDPNTAKILRAALRQRYRNDPRVIIEDLGVDFFAHAWEGNLICGHHGDIRKKPSDLVLGFAARYSQIWGSTVYRDLWTGHLHHIEIKELSGMTKNQIRAICPGDRHSNEELYLSHSEMMLRTYKKGGGRYEDKFFGFSDPLN